MIILQNREGDEDEDYREPREPFDIHSIKLKNPDRDFVCIRCSAETMTPYITWCESCLRKMGWTQEEIDKEKQKAAERQKYEEHMRLVEWGNAIARGEWSL